jgi:hypothetical protein
MRRFIAWILVVQLIGIQPLIAADNSWNRIRYSGGTVSAKLNPYDWNTTLTITPDAVVLVFGGKQTLRLAPSRITTLSYGVEAHRRVADMVALSFMLSPVALFGIFHKSKTHFVGIEYRTDDGKPGGVLLEADKNNYRDILRVLTIVTGKTVINDPTN